MSKYQQGDLVSYPVRSDILLARNNMELIDATKKWLSYIFKMKDMGEASMS